MLVALLNFFLSVGGSEDERSAGRLITLFFKSSREYGFL